MNMAVKRKKDKTRYSSGIGLENLRMRYKLISESLPETIQTEKEYCVTLPLIGAE